MEDKTIKWYKVHISFYDNKKCFFGFQCWNEVIVFLAKNCGWDVTIEAQNNTSLQDYVRDDSKVSRFEIESSSSVSECGTIMYNYRFEEK